MADIKEILDASVKVAEIFNVAAPGIASVIAIIRSTDGKVHVVPILNSAAETFDETIDMARAWKDDHPEG